MKKIIALIAAALAVFGMSASADYATWARNYVKLAVSEEIMQEKDEDGYENITRSHFCGLIYNVMNKKIGLEPSDDKLYSDTDSREVAALSAIAVIKGKGFGKFCPDDSLTREEAATIIARAADIIGARQVGGEALVFADAEEISDWAKSGIDRVARLGIMEGKGDKKFCPKDTYSITEGIATAVRLYCVTPVKMEGTKKTELMENVYSYQNGVSTWIEADGEIKACMDYYSGYDVCAGVLSDGTKVAALSQIRTPVARSKDWIITERKCKVYDLSDGSIIHNDDYTGHKIFNDYLLNYRTEEHDFTTHNYSNPRYTVSYHHNAYNLKTNESIPMYNSETNEYIQAWYEYADGESTILNTSDEVRLYRGNELIKTIRGKLTDPGQDGNEVPVFKTYFEVVTENGKELYDRDGNLVYSYPDNISYKAYKDKFEFTALEKLYEADTPYDEFTEELSKSVSAVCSAEKIHILNDGTEVLELDNRNVIKIMLTKDSKILAVECMSDKSDKHKASYHDNITLYNVSDGTERATLDKNGIISGLGEKNIVVEYYSDGNEFMAEYDMDGKEKLSEVRYFIMPTEYWFINTISGAGQQEYYATHDGLYRYKDHSLFLKGEYIASDKNYIEMREGDKIILYNYKKEVVLTADGELSRCGTSTGRKIFYSVLKNEDMRKPDHITVFDYETGECLIDAEGKLASPYFSLDDNRGVTFNRLIKLNGSEDLDVSGECVVDYDGNVISR